MEQALRFVRGVSARSNVDAARSMVLRAERMETAELEHFAQAQCSAQSWIRAKPSILVRDWI